MPITPPGTPPGAPQGTDPLISINALTEHRLRALVDDATWLRLAVSRLDNGCRIVDAGVVATGSLEAGRRIAEICLGGLGHVALLGTGTSEAWPLSMHVHTAHPVLACLGSQYAGWSLASREGEGAFQALGSGPGRALAQKEPLFQQLGYRDRAAATCLALEVDRFPPVPLTDRIARDCGVAPDALTLILTPTRSLAGTAQIVARVLEVALHKAHELGFPIHDIVDGAGVAPVPPPSRDFLTAMGRTNDAILFGGRVQLFVRGEANAARELAEALPSSTSDDYGRPFAQIFEACGHDFFSIDPMLFSPAEVTVIALDSGHSFHAGGVDEALLSISFGAE